MTIKKSFFVTSTGTEIGKTYISVKIIENFLKRNITIYPFKPILSGFNKKYLGRSDSGKLLIAINKKPSLSNIIKITPWLYSKALAPTVAAKYENKKILFKDLKKWCAEKKLVSSSDFVLFEGAGGLMVPIQGKKTFLDLFRDLNIPVILVVGSYLGTISHTLSAIENLYNNNVKLINIIFNEGNKVESNHKENLELLKSSLKFRIPVRSFSNNAAQHHKQISTISNDIIGYFNKMA